METIEMGGGEMGATGERGVYLRERDAARLAAREKQEADRDERAMQRYLAVAGWAAARLDGTLGRLERVGEERAVLEGDPGRAAEREVALGRERAARTVVWGLVLIGLADLFFVVPNLSSELAGRLAGGEPGWWMLVGAAVVCEALFLGTLVLFKQLGDVEKQRRKALAAASKEEYDAGRWGEWAAWGFRAMYVMLVSVAMWISFLAEQDKVETAAALQELMAELGGAGEGAAAGGGAALNALAGFTVLIWAMHVAVLFLSSGEFRRGGYGGLTGGELRRWEERLERRALGQAAVYCYVAGLSGRRAHWREELVARLPERVARRL